MTSAVAGALALWPAFERNSAISLLLAAILGGVALLSRWAWVFERESAAPYRWLLWPTRPRSCSARWRCASRRRRHAEVLIDAAGLAIAAIGVARSASPTSPCRARAPAAARLLGGRPARRRLRAGGLRRARPLARARLPGRASTSLLFILVGSGDDTLFWWPLVLIAVGCRGCSSPACARAARSPPEPPPYSAGAPCSRRRGGGRRAIAIRVRDDSR